MRRGRNGGAGGPGDDLVLTQTQHHSTRTMRRGQATLLAILALAWLLPVGCGHPDSSAPEVVRAQGEDAASAEAKPEKTAGTGLPFTVPPGYVAERVAGPPLVEQPMFACFDDRGRLFVAGSSGHNLTG